VADNKGKVVEPDLSELEGIIVSTAREVLLPRFAQTSRNFKADGSIVTEADLIFQQHLKQQLEKHWPAIPILAEEMSEDEQSQCLQHSRDGVWLLDPLDGTSNFAAGVPFYAVSIALLRQGMIQCGLVYDPQRDECFTAVKGRGAWLNGEPLEPVKPGMTVDKCIALIDFKRLSARLARSLVVVPRYASQRNFGSAALDWCWLAAGRVHVYLHGGQKLWDIAAGSLILEEAGGVSLTLEGEAVFQVALQSRSVVAAADPELFVSWREYIREAAMAGDRRLQV